MDVNHSAQHQHMMQYYSLCLSANLDAELPMPSNLNSHTPWTLSSSPCGCGSKSSLEKSNSITLKLAIKNMGMCASQWLVSLFPLLQHYAGVVQLTFPLIFEGGVAQAPYILADKFQDKIEELINNEEM